MNAIPTIQPCAVPSGLSPDAPEPLRLRRAVAADAAALALVGAATFLDAYTWMLPGADIIDFCRTQQTEAFYAKYLAEPSSRITLATTGLNTPVGYAMVCAPDFPGFALEPGDVELKRIYLLSRFRSRATAVYDADGELLDGMRGGQALMDAAISDARDLHAPRLLLGTNAGNARAIEFYIRNGFTEAGTRTFAVGTQQCCDYILAKAL
jgi:ribosomal protein S18 acetylase RimI-like enzyme